MGWIGYVCGGERVKKQVRMILFVYTLPVGGQEQVPEVAADIYRSKWPLHIVQNHLQDSHLP